MQNEFYTDIEIDINIIKKNPSNFVIKNLNKFTVASNTFKQYFITSINNFLVIFSTFFQWCENAHLIKQKSLLNRNCVTLYGWDIFNF